MKTPLERARSYFQADRFATQALGAQIDEVREGYARCSLRLEEKHRNAQGAVMGGVLFTLADFAFAVASNLDHPPTVSLCSQIAFLAPPAGDTLCAVASVVRDGRSTCFYRVTVTDERGAIAAEVTVSGFVKRYPAGEKHNAPEVSAP